MAHDQSTGAPPQYAIAQPSEKTIPTIKDQSWFTKYVGDILSAPVCKHFWVLGAGASKESGIPDAAELAVRWFKDLENCEDTSSDSCYSACTECAIKTDLSGDFGKDYFEIYHRRFEADPRAGYFALLKNIDGKTPSYGYMVLAEIMRRSTSKIAVTVNFDNLLADALHIVTNRAVQVIGHERIADNMLYDWEVPVVCKIHRDITMQPMSTTQEMAKLSPAWANALRRVFDAYSPIFIGYGGNDRTLMGFLNEFDGKFPAKPIWLEFEPEERRSLSTSNLPQDVLDFLVRHDGVIVKHSGFDYIFKLIQNKHLRDFDPVSSVEVFSSQFFGAITKSIQLTAERVSEHTPHAKLIDEIEKRSTKSLDDYLILASNARTPAKKIAIYRMAIQEFTRKKSASSRLVLSRLYNNLGHVYMGSKKYQQALRCFESAIMHWPEYIVGIYNKACCLAKMGREVDCIETLAEAIYLDPRRRERAARDGDFESVSHLPAFQRLVQQRR